MTTKQQDAECQKCFDEFTSKSDTLFREFNVKSDDVMRTIINKTDELFKHLKEETNTFIENKSKKVDEFYEAQEARYDKLESKMISAVKFVLGIVLFIVSVYGAVIGFLFVEVDKKAYSTDVLSLKDAYTIRVIGDKYYDQRYVIKSGEQVDKSTYEWHMETIFQRLSRGEKIIATIPEKVNNN